MLEPGSLATRAVLGEVSSAITSLAFDPAGTRLVTAHTSGELVLRDPASNAVLARSVKLPVPRSVCFSSDGEQLAVAGDGALLGLFDARTLEERTSLAGHAREVFSAAFSPDGSRLFSGGRDGILRVWDPASGDLLGEFAGHRDYIWSLAVSPDGARVVSGSGDCDVRLWESEPASVTDRRRREALELAARARTVVAGLLAELGRPEAVVERLERDASATPAQRQADLDELLRQARAGR